MLSCQINSEILKGRKMNRNRVIDAEKGLCMILIIAGHSPYVSHLVESFITMFHVPLFFFVSAYLFNYSQDFWAFFKRKVQTLLKPLFIVVLITTGVAFAKSLIKGNISDGLMQVFFSIAGGILQWNGTDFEGQKWFMACLFSSLILFYFLVKLVGKEHYKAIVFSSIVISVIGLVYCESVSIRIPWYIDIACATMYCWGLGYAARRVIHRKVVDAIYKYWLPISLLLFCCVTCFAYANQKYVTNTVDIHNAVFGNWVYWIMGAILGTIFVVVLSMKWFKYSKTLLFIGENSIVFFLYAWTARPIVNMSIKMWNKLGIIEPTILWITEIMIVLGVCAIESILFRKYFPEIIGKRRK